MNAYERDPYLAELEVQVVGSGSDAQGAYCLLDDTILYPEGGGQPADTGTLDGARVRDVQRVDGEIRHYVDEPVTAGRATLRLDWGRRFDHMQQHTAQHVITAIAADEMGWQTTSFHLGERTADIELDVESLDDDDLGRLEKRANQRVREGLSVTARRVTADSIDLNVVRSRGLPEGHDGDVRLVEIADLDCNTCGGTHLADTAQIGAIKLLGSERMRGGTRVFWVAGDRVLALLAAHERRAATLRALFETSDGEVADVAAAKLERLNDAERRLRRLSDELAVARATELVAGGDPVHDADFDGAGPGFLQAVARRLIAAGDPRPGLLSSTDDSGSYFVVVVPSRCPIDAAVAGAQVAELLGGRGGGAGEIYQGKAGSLSARGRALEALRDLLGAADR